MTADDKHPPDILAVPTALSTDNNLTSKQLRSKSKAKVKKVTPSQPAVAQPASPPPSQMPLSLPQENILTSQLSPHATALPSASSPPSPPLATITISQPSPQPTATPSATPSALGTDDKLNPKSMVKATTSQRALTRSISPPWVPLPPLQESVTISPSPEPTATPSALLSSPPLQASVTVSLEPAATSSAPAPSTPLPLLPCHLEQNNAGRSPREVDCDGCGESGHEYSTAEETMRCGQCRKWSHKECMQTPMDLALRNENQTWSCPSCRGIIVWADAK
jgi:hypothetical protein